MNRPKLKHYLLIICTGLLIACQQSVSNNDTTSTTSESSSAIPAIEENNRTGELTNTPEATNAAFDSEPTIPEQAEILQEGVFISEIMVASADDDAYEFVELVNLNQQTADLAGHSLWYQSDDDGTPVQVIEWLDRADIPAFGRYLLVREGADVGLIADRSFTIALESNGVLWLRDPSNDVIDMVSWGAVSDIANGDEPAAPIGPGQSLKRKSTQAVTAQGDYLDLVRNSAVTENSQADFELANEVAPENTGGIPHTSMLLPISIRLDMPETVAIGESFVATLIVTNFSYTGDDGITVHVVIPDSFETPGLEGVIQDGRLETQTLLQVNDELAVDIRLIAPNNEEEFVFSGSYVDVKGRRSYAPVKQLITESAN